MRWERAQPTDQAPALMSPVLWDVLAALPADASGIWDRALLLVGFVGAFRRSELAAIEVRHIEPHPKGLVTIPQSKTDPSGDGQLVVLPCSSRAERCPAVCVRAWLDAADAGTSHETGPTAGASRSAPCTATGPPWPVGA